MDEPKIQRGRALVLAGPQGCGKTMLARKLAAEFGSFIEDDQRVLQSDFALGRVLARRPDVVVVDVVNAGLLDTRAAKSLVSSEWVTAHRVGKSEEIVPTPAFVFCMDGPVPRLDDRWFLAITLGAQATVGQTWRGMAP